MQGLVEIGQDDFFRQCIFAISLLSPLMKGTIFFAQECFVQSVVEIDPVVLEKKMKI